MLKSNKKVKKVKPLTDQTRYQLQFNLPRDYLLDKRIKPKDVFEGWSDSSANSKGKSLKNTKKKK
tara:strand:+ start:159 stop:353 length:195 start_codon:yes stop_codon:yes gene_type:complete